MDKKALGSVSIYEKFSVDEILKPQRGEGVGTRTVLDASQESGIFNETVAHEMQHQHDRDKNNVQDFAPRSVLGAKRPQEIRAVNTQNLFNYKTGRSMITKYGNDPIAKELLIDYWKGQKHPNQK